MWALSHNLHSEDPLAPPPPPLNMPMNIHALHYTILLNEAGARRIMLDNIIQLT